jgi:hypothetical protein
MIGWGFWDWVAYSTLYIGAIIFAIETAISSSASIRAHIPNFIKSNIWAFIPAILLTMATIVFIFNTIGWLPLSTGRVTNYSQWPVAYRPEIIRDQEFENRVIDLDGFDYVNCLFRNVTFKYNGTTPIQFEQNKVYGTIGIDTDNPAVTGTLAMVEGFGMTMGPLRKIGPGKTSHVEYPTLQIEK